MLTPLRIGCQKSINFANRLNVRLNHFRKDLIMPIRNVLVINIKRIKSKAKTGDSDRNKEKGDYDGTDDTLRTDSVGHVPSQELKEPSGKERDLSNRPDG